MKRILYTSLMVLLVFLFNTTSVGATNTSGNDEWYTESQIASELESQITYEGIYVSTFTFPDVTSRIDNDIPLSSGGDSCKVWFEMTGFDSYDSNNFEVIDSQNIKFIGEDDTISYSISVIGTLSAAKGFLCLYREDFSNQIITISIQPDVSNFFESCGTFDLTCQADVVSKGVVQLPDLAENANETMDHVDTIAGGFPAMKFGLALFFIGIIITLKKWFS